MLKTRIVPWNQIDIQALVNLIYEVFQASGDSRLARISLEGMEQWLQRLRFDIPPVSVEVRLDDKLVGWALLFKQDLTRVELNPWALNGHPFVRPREDTQTVIATLIKEAQAYARREGFTRLELNFKQIPEESTSFYDRYPCWYETLGFQLVTETAIMRRSLENFDLGFPELQTGFMLRPLFDFDDEIIYRIYHDVYSASLNRFFLDQSEEERRAFFDDDFSREDPVNGDTSLMLLWDQEPIGFSLMRPTHGEGNLHLWKFGIHQEYRRRGLGKGLLRLIMGRSSEQGIRTMSLGVEPNNTPAYQLYLSHGFNEEFRQTEYAWKPG
jgi:ribosomal protein S18 acetylase RimI-like enzyme